DHGCHEDHEAHRAQRAVRRQDRVEARIGLRWLVVVGHDLLTLSNLNRKTMDAKAKFSSARRAKSSPARRKPGAKLKPEAVREIFRRFAAACPEPKSELEHYSPYTLLVAVVLSAQATDAGVNKATRSLFKVADTPQKMVALGEERVREYIKTIGLYRNKAKNVIALSEQLIASHGGKVPHDRAALESLPG